MKNNPRTFYDWQRTFVGLDGGQTLTSKPTNAFDNAFRRQERGTDFTYIKRIFSRAVSTKKLPIITEANPVWPDLTARDPN